MYCIVYVVQHGALFGNAENTYIAHIYYLYIYIILSLIVIHFARFLCVLKRLFLGLI